MFDRIDPRSPVPLYAQIATRIRVAVASSELGTGDALPSVRALATQLRINPATVVQAYRELERDGTVEMRHGAGTFVAAVSLDRRRQTKQSEARRLVRELLSNATRAGIDPEILRRVLNDELEAHQS